MGHNMANNKKAAPAGTGTASNNAFNKSNNSTSLQFAKAYPNALPKPWVLVFVRVEVVPYDLGCNDQSVADMEEKGYKLVPVWDDSVGISIRDWIWREYPMSDSTRENIMQLSQGSWRSHTSPNGCITYRYEVKP